MTKYPIINQTVAGRKLKKKHMALSSKFEQPAHSLHAECNDRNIVSSFVRILETISRD